MQRLTTAAQRAGVGSNVVKTQRLPDLNLTMENGHGHRRRTVSLAYPAPKAPPATRASRAYDLEWRLLLLGSVAGAWVGGVLDLNVTADGPVVCGLAVGGLQLGVRSDERLIALPAEVNLPVLSEGRSSEQHDGEQLNQAHQPFESAVTLGEITSAPYRDKCRLPPIGYFEGAGQVARHEAVCGNSCGRCPTRLKVTMKWCWQRATWR